MQSVQLVLSDGAYAKKLKQLLAESGNWAVSIKDAPSFHKHGVVVLDEKILAAMACAPEYADRIVLITNNDPDALSHAWNLGIRSVVFHSDPPGTTLLAIMAAYLRLPKLPQSPHRRGISPNGPNPILNGHSEHLTRRHE
jgi:hypothetical protein